MLTSRRWSRNRLLTEEPFRLAFGVRRIPRNRCFAGSGDRARPRSTGHRPDLQPAVAARPHAGPSNAWPGTAPSPTVCQPSSSRSATAPRRFLRNDSLGQSRHRRAPSANFWMAFGTKAAARKYRTSSFFPSFDPAAVDFDPRQGQSPQAVPPSDIHRTDDGFPFLSVNQPFVVSCSLHGFTARAREPSASLCSTFGRKAAARK